MAFVRLCSHSAGTLPVQGPQMQNARNKNVISEPIETLESQMNNIRDYLYETTRML
jgi:hypothetical protein